jgi:hypothetical protein
MIIVMVNFHNLFIITLRLVRSSDKGNCLKLVEKVAATFRLSKNILSGLTFIHN